MSEHHFLRSPHIFDQPLNYFLLLCCSASGDAWVSSDGGMLTLDTGALHTKWIRDIYDEQARAIAAGKGACAPNIAPAECPGGVDSSGNCKPSCGAPPWAIAAVVIPYNMWRYHGDARLLRSVWPKMRLFMEWLDSTADNSTGLVMQDGLADWCPPQNVATDPKSVSSFSQIMGWKMMAEAADGLGEHSDAAAIRKRLARLSSAYTKAYYNSTSGCFSDSATTQSSPQPNVQTSNSMVSASMIAMTHHAPSHLRILCRRL